jgi:hypothetical protein
VAAASVVAIVGLILSAGCNPPQSDKMSATPPEPVVGVDHLMMDLTPPAVLTFGDRSGPGGVQVRLFFFQKGKNLPVTVSGTLDAYLYESPDDGKVVSRASLENARPLHTWQFSGEQLRQYLAKTIIGWGYVVPLAWGQDVPSADKITIQARYSVNGASYVYADPVTIPAGLK